MAPDTWDPNGGREIEIDDLLAFVERHVPEGVDGVTISGGEPFQQPSALHELLGALHELRSSLGADWDFLCYTGYQRPHVESEFLHIIELLDALVPGPFVASRPSAGVWRGSANQEIVPVSSLGGDRYSPQAMAARRRSLQVDASSGRFSLIGVPRRGDIETMRRRLSEQGIEFEDVAWR